MLDINKKASTKYALIQAIFWASIGAIFVYSSVYLLDKGFTNSTVGYVMALGYIVSVVLPPFIGNFADKSKKMIVHKIVISMSLFMILASAFLLSFDKTKWIVAFFFAVLVAISQSLIPFINSLGMFFINKGLKINFGIARAIGSLTFSLSSMLIGYLIDKFASVNFVIYMVSLVYILLIIIINKFHFVGIEEVNDFDENTENGNSITYIEFFNHHRRFTLVLFGIVLVFISYNMMGNYMFQIVSHHGHQTKEMGTIISIGGMLELPALFGLSLLMKKITSGNLMRISCFFIFVRVLFTYLASDLSGVYFALVFQLLGFGLFSGANVYYARDVLDEKYLVRGQALINSSITLGAVLSSVIGGRLLDLAGVNTMLFYAAVFAGLGFLIVSIFTEKTHIKNEGHD